MTTRNTDTKSETPTTNKAVGEELSAKSQILETGASVTQNFAPIKSICAHLNAFHCYATDASRCVEANHYCSHLNEDVRQCLIYDSPEKNARLIGVEYMISPKLYATLPEEERRLWHSHVYEVKSGMLIMPTPAVMPSAVWDIAEQKEMEEVVGIYGKTFHFWQVDREDKLPLGMPQLMMSFNGEFDVTPELRKMWADRDERFNVESADKAKQREYIKEPDIHPDADQKNKKYSEYAQLEISS
ncbi:MAG: hypothetical protein GOMPHAMPRED_005795 [Gomphillus americanus]|uniref:DUF1264-domain-containing protein n=1 Tax=Gomphillus americanus TaxID=1940652 RepID=A0A8H3FXH2_9LECA|nr:MAG: hypothetical protein GOMPHAMPRED_005795 [Gomphillus americanus]